MYLPSSIRCALVVASLSLGLSDLLAETPPPEVQKLSEQNAAAVQNESFLIVEPGPVVVSTLYNDGSVVAWPSKTKWRPMCGGKPNITRKEFMRQTEPLRNEFDKALQAPQPQKPEGGGVNIIFSNAASVPAAALPAIATVETYIEGLFADVVTFQINVSYANLGGGVLGATGSNYVFPSYTTVRNGLINGMDGDDSIQAFLPAGSACPVRYNGSSDTITNEFFIDVTRANYKATVGSASNLAAGMTFNTAFSWDYDPSNGISGGTTDFQSVLVHEVIHAMGFTSGVDDQCFNGSNAMEMMDIFRFSGVDGCCDYDPDTVMEFQTAPRIGSCDNPNNQHYTDLGTLEYQMEDGNPWQASHFDESVNAIMDPNIASGQSFWPNFMRTPDLTVLDAIGWEYPICTLPCDDGDVCTVNEICSGTTCVGNPVDCAAAGDDCNAASCDPSGGEGNCTILTPANEGGPCDGGTGICQAGVCGPDPGDTRVFMVRAGQQVSAPANGPTSLTMAQGGSVTVEVWLADTDPQSLGGYQIAIEGTATPQGGANGTVTYVDNNPGVPIGDSVLVDQARSDWALFPLAAQATVFYAEGGLPDGFAFIGTLPFGQGNVINGLAYLGEFQLTASPGAISAFTLNFIPVGMPPDGGSGLSDQTGAGQIIAQYQPLNITVEIGVPCTTATQCGDALPPFGIVDDNCFFFTCDGSCSLAPRIFADMGGAFGLCPSDGFANAFDANHALLCFADVNPCDGINIDAGGPFGDCAPDGFCNLFDANHALAAFAQANPCSCPANGPAPTVDPIVVGQTGITVDADQRCLSRGETVDVKVILTQPLDDLRGYQLDLDVSGGRAGTLELVAVELERTQAFVFNGRGDTFDATNIEKSQVLCGLVGEGVETPASAYLATFTYRASEDAVGTFVIDVPKDGQTYLVATDNGKIEPTRITPAVILVTQDARALR